MTYQDSRMLRLQPGTPDRLAASIHGVIDAETAQRLADRLAALLAAETREVHLDVDQANPLSAAAAAILLFPLLQAARTHDPSITLTVHRADSRTSARMHELGLDRLVTRSDQPA